MELSRTQVKQLDQTPGLYLPNGIIWIIQDFSYCLEKELTA